jgi:DNA-binding transcriptional LysR family regulator
MFQDLNHIPLFVSIVRAQSLSGAAVKLHMPVATISRKLAEMERNCGARLVERSARHFSLTEVGSAYFEKAALLYEQLHEAQVLLQQSQTKVEGKIRVTMPVDFGTEFLAKCLTEFVQIYPEIELEIDLSTKRLNFTDEDIDLAVRMGPLPDGSQVSRNLGLMSRSLYASPSVAAQWPLGTHPNDLKQAQFVLLDSLSPGHLLKLKHRKSGRETNLTCRGSIRVNSMGMLMSLVAAGAGIGVIPDALALPSVESGKLMPVAPQLHASSVEVHLLYRERALLPKRLQLLIAHVQRHLMSLDVLMRN